MKNICRVLQRPTSACCTVMELLCTDGSYQDSTRKESCVKSSKVDSSADHGGGRASSNDEPYHGAIGSLQWYLIRRWLLNVIIDRVASCCV